MNYEKVNDKFRTYKEFTFDDTLMLLVSKVEEYVNLVTDSEDKRDMRLQQLKDAIALLTPTEIDGLDEGLKILLGKYNLI